MVRIRLRRQGAKKKPSYRIVVADSRAPRDGRYIENIGFYDPRTDPPTVRIKADRALYWLGVGAQPTDPVLRLLKKTGVWQQFKGIEVQPEAAQEEAAEPPAEEAGEAAKTEAEVEAISQPETETEEAVVGEAGEEEQREA